MRWPCVSCVSPVLLTLIFPYYNNRTYWDPIQTLNNGHRSPSGPHDTEHFQIITYFTLNFRQKFLFRLCTAAAFCVLVMGDTQNFIHDKYREKISRYSIYRDTDLWPSTYFITHRMGGVDNLLYALYMGRGLSLLMLNIVNKIIFCVI